MHDRDEAMRPTRMLGAGLSLLAFLFAFGVLLPLLTGCAECSEGEIFAGGPTGRGLCREGKIVPVPRAELEDLPEGVLPEGVLPEGETGTLHLLVCFTANENGDLVHTPCHPAEERAL